MTTYAHRLRQFGGALLCLSFLAGTASAQSAPAQDQVIQITPYAWATGMGGTIRPFAGAPTVRIDKSFSDIIRDLDAAFFISAYARRGDLVFMGDFSTSTSSRRGVLPAPPAPAPLPARGRLRQTSLTLLAGHRVASTPEATFDLLAGLRHWNLRASVTVPPAPPVFPGASASRSRSFTDPILAARANFRLAPGWSALVYADIGGFGVGSRSTAQVVGTVNYQVRENVFLSAGYRHLHVDYRSGGSRFDIRAGGPLVGVTVRF